MENFRNILVDENSLTVFIDIITICQQHCWYCYARPESTGRKNWNKILPFTKIRKILDALSYSKYEINLCLYGGEPTLHKDFNAILEYADKINSIRKIEIFTNGLRDLSKIYRSDKISYTLSFHPSQTKGEKLIKNALFLKANDISFTISCLYDGEHQYFYDCINVIKENNLSEYIKLGIVDSHRKDRPLTVRVPDTELFKSINEKVYLYNNELYTLDEIRERNLNNFHGWKCCKGLIKISVDGVIFISGGDYNHISLEQLKHFEKPIDVCNGFCCADENNLIFNRKFK